ncbi:integrase core domain-containing protein [Mesorhizobium sp.]|uniref:integrase core domain-containing protein n=2 Tax=unclassified Mesorhizobium TaxID=325217 RepID=UPI000F752675|nr:integrase core domain-containing protein [Mesorhizobium sp.]AZO31290.1 IS481 family transposase [Mesorhizobium sp. M1B.F.Ca.ET.045.04.1.1]AZO31385.1 IS481 family transposase [Mesorhizobium sp. M1B.F.Ca.ET.045.04.1.1]RWA71792.1 MAG: IS481 family transposase [Mesorhizobium sp.]
MVWTGQSIEDVKRRFIVDRLSGEWGNMSELCAQYGISRETGYELMRRYATEGFGSVVARSRAPLVQAGAVKADVCEALVDCRLDHPTWGPRKLKAFLERTQPQIAWPAASTIGDMLKRRGLVGKRRRRRSALPLTRPFAPVCAANETWCIDFKGWFRTQDGTRCDPLTVSDAMSRYLLGCRICAPIGASVKVEMDRILKEFGLPDRFRIDNGSPWGSVGAGGLTALSVKWLKLGIGLEFITPAKPQENGRHERMHGTLKADTLRPPAATAADQQRRFDAFRRSYNEERPHEALGQQTPASHYEPSRRAYPHRIEEPAYAGDGIDVRRVRRSGEIKWRGQGIFIGEAFIGEPVALAETETGDQCVRFMTVDLGLIDRKTGRFRRFGPPRPSRTNAKTTNADSKTVNHVPGP